MEHAGAMFKKGMRDGIPICLGYLAVSFTFGIAAKKAGFFSFEAAVMSLTNLTSAGQFAALEPIAASAPFWELALIQFVINLRYSLMSCALSQKLEKGTPIVHRFLMAYGISDEIFAGSAAVLGRLSPFYTYGLMAAAVPGWTLGTLLGAALGGVMPVRLLSACGVALYGMFIASTVPKARKSRRILGLMALTMAAGALLSVLPGTRELSPGFRVILLTVLLGGGAAFFFPIEEGEDGR